jgi:hypothetical protein
MTEEQMQFRLESARREAGFNAVQHAEREWMRKTTILYEMAYVQGFEHGADGKGCTPMNMFDDHVKEVW